MLFDFVELVETKNTSFEIFDVFFNPLGAKIEGGVFISFPLDFEFHLLLFPESLILFKEKTIGSLILILKFSLQNLIKILKFQRYQ